MDPSSSNTKKRGSSNEAEEVQEGFKRSCSSSSLPTGSGHETTQLGDFIRKLHESFMAGKVQELKPEIEKRMAHTINSLSGEHETEAREIVDDLIKEKRAEWESEFRQLVSKELDGIAQHQLKPLPPILSNQHERGSETGTSKLSLRFCNPIANVMYHKDKMSLKFELCDAYSNMILSTGRLSSAPVDIFLFEQENDSRKPPTFVSVDKLMELMSFNALQQLRLQNGIGYVKDLIIKPSSYWISKKFFLVVKVMDEEILMKTGVTIEYAISEPFTVKTNRMKGFKKHHPPTKSSEVWRLVGISKGGVYHRILSSEEIGIKTVGDFLRKYHEMGSQALKEILGEKMSMELWNKIVEHAKKCVGYDPTHYHQIIQANSDTDHLVRTEVQPNSNHILEVHNHRNQSFEDNNNNLVGTGLQASSNQHLGVVNQKNQSFDQITTNLEEANYSKEKFEVGENDKLPRTASPNQQWFLQNINLDLLDSSSNWAAQTILESPNPYGIDYRHEQSQELGP